jgi:hypothetical protein
MITRVYLKGVMGVNWVVVGIEAGSQSHQRRVNFWAQDRTAHRILNDLQEEE